MEKEYPHNAHPIHRRPDQRRYSKYYDPDDENPTSAETLPWRRDQLNLAEELTKQMNNGNNTSRFSNDYKQFQLYWEAGFIKSFGINPLDGEGHNTK